MTGVVPADRPRRREESPSRPTPPRDRPEGSRGRLAELQRDAGNGATSRLIQVQRDEITMDPEVVRPGAPDWETQREIDIAEHAATARVLAEGRINAHQISAIEAITAFRDSATTQIAALPGAPSPLWGLLPTLFSAVVTVVTTVNPPAGVGLKLVASLGTAAVGAGASQLTAGIGSGRQARKDDAARAMVAFAQSTSNALARGYDAMREALPQEVLTRSTSDEAFRELVIGTDQLDAAATALGVPDPRTAPQYGPIREALEVTFAEYLARQRFLADEVPDTAFWRGVTDLPGTELNARMVGSQQAAAAEARARVQEAAGQRRPPGAAPR